MTFNNTMEIYYSLKLVWKFWGHPENRIFRPEIKFCKYCSLKLIFYLTSVRISLFTQRWSLMSERSLIQVLLLLQRVAAKSGTRSEGGECSIKIRLVSAHYLSQWRKGQRFLVCFFGDICRTFMYFGISSTCFCCWICWASWTKGSKKSVPSKKQLVNGH